MKTEQEKKGICDAFADAFQYHFVIGLDKIEGGGEADVALSIKFSPMDLAQAISSAMETNPKLRIAVKLAAAMNVLGLGPTPEMTDEDIHKLFNPDSDKTTDKS